MRRLLDTWSFENHLDNQSKVFKTIAPIALAIAAPYALGALAPTVFGAGASAFGGALGAGTALGGTIGASIGTAIMPGVGTVLGGLVGAGLGQTGTRALAGIDINDPYSGPDLSIPIFGGIPITPYAKTKRKKERAREELGKDMAALEPYLQKQMGREMAAQQQIVSGNLMNTALANARFGR